MTQQLSTALLQYDFILTNYTCEDLIGKQGHILRFQVDMNIHKDTTQPTTEGYTERNWDKNHRDIFIEMWALEDEQI